MPVVAGLNARRSALIAWLAVALCCAAVTPLVSATPAEARSCGFNSDEYYRHCGTTRVLVTARNFWGTQYTVCVGPGDTYLGNLSTWRITNAWYIGWLC